MRNVETSVTHPLRVDYLPDVGLPGTIGITSLPGARYYRKGVQHVRSLTADLARLRDVYYTNDLVTLVEPFELEMCGVPDLPILAGDCAMVSHLFPIPDHKVPDRPAPFEALVRELHGCVDRGRNIVVHCRAGKGRAPTLVACLLVWHGLTAAEAIDMVQAYRPECLSNRLQRQYIAEFERQIGGLP